MSYVCLRGVEKFLDSKGLFKLLSKAVPAHLQPTHLFKTKTKTFAFAKFDSEQARQKFLEFQSPDLRRIKAQKTELQRTDVHKLQSVLDLMKEREVRYEVATEQQLKEVRQKDIRDVVMPFWRKDYEEQVALKTSDIKAQLKKLNEKCDVKQPAFSFLQSESRTHYRNKTEFTVGLDEKGEIEVGFNKGNFKNKTVTVSDPALVDMLPDEAIKTAHALKVFFRSKAADFPAYDRYEHSGVWRYVAVRTSQRTKQTLVMVVGGTQSCDPASLQACKSQLVKVLRQEVKSLVGVGFLAHNGKSDSIPYDPPQLLWGQPFYEEQILGCRFKVSFHAFLQVHTKMCEILYSKVLALLESCDVVLDLCSGIGTIGICLAKQRPGLKIIGIEIIEDACINAVQNKTRNEVEYEVVCGRVEDKLKEVIDQFAGSGKRIVAVLDPPRAGLTKDTVKMLRTCRGLDQIVYIACSLPAVLQNLASLCAEVDKKHRAPGFDIVEVTGLDLFPSTQHYETLLMLQRRQFN